MKPNVNRRTMIAVAVAAVVIGVVIAILAVGGDGDHSSQRPRAGRAGAGHTQPAGNMAVAARYLSLTPTQIRQQLSTRRTLAAVADHTNGKSAAGLIAAIVGAKAARTQTGPSAGATTTSQSDSLAAIHARVAAWVRRVRHVSSGNADLAGAAKYLGMSVARVHSEQQHGHSLAQLAEASNGKSASGLIAAIVHEREETLTTAVANGRISLARAKLLAANLQRRISHEVKRSPAQQPTG